MRKHLFLIHGRNFKPQEKDIEYLWLEAIRCGLERDYPGKLSSYNGIKKKFIYYGGISNDFLGDKLGTERWKARYSDKIYDQGQDTKDRQTSLDRLKKYSKQDFVGKYGLLKYKKLTGSTAASLKQKGASIASWLTNFIRLNDLIIGSYAADVKEYWNQDSKFGSDIRETLTIPLCDVLKKEDDVLLISHSLGSMVAYDVLWKISYYSEYKELRNKNTQVAFITLGSPLGEPSVQRNLKGSGAKNTRKYPSIICSWDNLAAVGDYIAHDLTLEDDYQKMLRSKMVTSITDHKIYNLAVRYGKANPHHGVGYLIHPTFIKILVNWINK